MKESSVAVATPYEIIRLHGDGDSIEQVSISNLETGKMGEKSLLTLSLSIMV